MTPSNILRIDTIDKDKRVIWSEQFLSKYKMLLSSIKEAGDLIFAPKKEGEPKKPFSAITENLQKKINTLKFSLEEKLTKVSNEKAKIGLNDRIKSLSQIEPRNLNKFQENIAEIYKFKEFHPLVRKAVFAWSLMKNKDQKDRIQNLFDREPDIDTVSTMLDFIDHITNQETFADYFTDKKAADNFSDIVNTRALQQDFAKAQNTDAVGTVPVQFVPQRNLLTEFSGHIADACWASKYNSILKSFPNFSSVIMMQDPGGRNERLVGSAMLIETKDKKGNPLLVIRGLNPIENFINRFSIKDFYEKFTGYIKEIAAKNGRKVAIVIDDHSGGSGTNRPALFEYMNAQRENSKKVSLPNKGTNFNGYDISDECIMVK